MLREQVTLQSPPEVCSHLGRGWLYVNKASYDDLTRNVSIAILRTTREKLFQYTSIRHENPTISKEQETAGSL